MRVIVVPHNPLWTQAFVEASAEAAAALGKNLLEIHHIGSTSIPGIHAKPIIDMLAIVSDLSAVDERASQMMSLGYEPKGEFGIPERRYFRRDNTAARGHTRFMPFKPDHPKSPDIWLSEIFCEHILKSRSNTVK